MKLFVIPFWKEFTFLKTSECIESCISFNGCWKKNLLTLRLKMGRLRTKGKQELYKKHLLWMERSCCKTDILLCIPSSLCRLIDCFMLLDTQTEWTKTHNDAAAGLFVKTHINSKVSQWCFKMKPKSHYFSTVQSINKSLCVIPSRLSTQLQS